MADFHAMKHTSTAATSNVNQQKPTKSTVNHPATPTAPSKRIEGYIAGKMANLKKWLHQPTVRMNISSWYIQKYITPIIPCVTI